MVDKFAFDSIRSVESSRTATICGARLCEPQHVGSGRRAGFVKTLGGRQSSGGSQTDRVRHV